MSLTPIDCEPFESRKGSELFGSPVVAGEYAKLCRDHKSLVNLGQAYGGFDPSGALYSFTHTA